LNPDTEPPELRSPANENIFRSLCDQALTGIYILEKGRLTYVNRAMADIFGYEPEDMIGAEPSLIVYPEDLALVREHLQRRLSAEVTSAHYEFRGLRKNGEIRIIEVLGTHSEFNHQPTIIGNLIDITERKQTEQALEQEKNLLSGLVHTIPDLVWLKDPQGVYMSCNPRFQAFFGASETEIVGKTDFDFVDAEQAQFFRQNDQAVVASGQSLSNEEWLTFASDGYRGLFETIKTPMYDAENQLVGVLGIAREITEQKQTETKLANLNRIYAVLSAVNEAVVRIRDPQILFEEVCRIAVETGKFRMAWMGQRTPDGSLVLPSCHAGNSQGYVEALHLSLSQKQGPTSHAMLSGHYRVCNDIAQDPIMLPWRDAALERGYRSSGSFPIQVSGSVTASINLYADTPDFFDPQEIELLLQLCADLGFALEFAAAEAASRQQLEALVSARTEELKESERRFRRLVEGVQQDYFFFSVGEDQFITYLSPSAEEFLGQKMEAMLGKPWYEVFQLGASAQELGEQIIAQMMKGVNPPPFEIEIELRGQKQTLEISEHIRYSPTGNLLGGEGVVKNITRQKRIEAELREAKDKAEKASQAKSLFLANMSHEIRTPLNVILGFSEMMHEKIQDSRYQNYLQAINSSGKTLLNIINDILDLSKIEAGKLQLNPQNVSLKALFQDLDVLLRFSFEKKGLNFRLDLSDDVPPLLLLDALRLRQILLNLLYNALKFTHTGEVCLSASYQALNQESGALCLRVRDTGIGIAPEFQERIFEAFEQADSENEFSGGTGLGLAISLQLIKLMQGKLTLESALGKGSTFQIVLPQVKKAPETAAFKPEETHANALSFEFAPAKLLVADDVAQNLDLVQAYLETSPLQIKTAQNGQEAYEQALSDLPDLILMDIKMPVMNGIEALEQLKANPQTQAIPVVALTAYSLQQERESLLNKGFNGYLQKPISKNELLDCLKTFLKGQTHPHDPETMPTPMAPQMPQTPTFEQDSAEQQEQFQTLLQQDWLPRWKDIQDSLILDELESFAQDLITLAEHHKQPTLKGYAKQLLNDVESFVLESAQERLKAFPNLVQSLNRAGEFELKTGSPPWLSGKTQLGI
jgi:PAS domain S-box-containing protein